MPYQLTFVHRLPVARFDHYINPCCVGGDLIVDRLRPLLSADEDLQTDQEDWGWFIWIRRGALRLAIDVHCDDPETGAFAIRLTARRSRLFWSTVVDDDPDLEQLRDAIVAELRQWLGVEPRIERVAD